MKNSTNKSRFLRLLSALLSVMSVLSLVTIAIPASFAADAAEEEQAIIDYYTEVYDSPEAKLAAMELKVDNFGYQLYYENYSGEVALVNKASGQILFSNPYDIATNSTYFPAKTPSNDTKSQLMSQIIIKYTDNDQEKNYYSYVEAAQRDQILCKNLKNGIRVEYTIGQEETRSLVPRLINATRFETLIRDLIDDEQALKKIDAFYTLKDPEDPKLTVRGVKELQATFPITTQMAVYVFDPYASAREVNLIESYIKAFCPEYTFSELDYDHQLTEYEGADTAPALFKLALEYYLNEDGLQVRLPANGIRFDETNYSLTYIQILPYMGCGSYDYEGYTFLPDGSGSIMRFEDFYGTNLTVSGDMYGKDYAKHELTGQHQEIIRLPVYGIVEDLQKVNSYEETVTETVVVVDDEGEEVEEEHEVTNAWDVDISQKRGFVAIITEGDSLARVTTSHGGALHKYCSVYTQFYPRPKDSYNLAESISVGSNATWTVVSKRKYTGSYRIQYVMLTDPAIAKSKGIKDYYETSYYGMADAYRDYLVKNGDITKLTAADVKSDIPLYIETFGIIEKQETILSIPVMVKTPLTSFEDIKSMTEELGQNGITNLVYRLTGYYNGGMDTSYPATVKMEKKAGGESGFKDLESYAAQKNIDLYLDFDFVYCDHTEFMDGFSYRKDAVKTIDNRYTTKREYDPVYQTWGRSRLNAVSPSVYEKLYEKFAASVEKLGMTNISVSTLGSDVNSDFDKKDPYNREDGKEYTTEVLEEIASDYNKVMIDAGNAYALKYASTILNAPIDSSRYYYSSQMIPFYGIVLHGYIPFAGEPTNMAGDINYEILKMLESGAYPYFTLSYQNTEYLKDSKKLAKYYSISYEIWKEDLITRYNELNEALKDVQTAEIVGHEFIADAERVPSEAEKAADKAAAAEAAKLAAEEAAKKAEKAEKAEKLAARKKAEQIEELEKQIAEGTAKGDDVTKLQDKLDALLAPEEEKEVKEEEEFVYVANDYTCALGTVVKVTYENGVSFILNYNSYQITVGKYTIDALSYVKIS